MVKTIEVSLAHCCQNYVFNFGGRTVIHNHDKFCYVESEFNMKCEIRVLELPLAFDMPKNIFDAHTELASYLNHLGEKCCGYETGYYFQLPLRDPQIGPKSP